MTPALQILTVDDSQVVRAYVRSILEKGGFTVDEAENGVAGVERVSSKRYDLILVDINMAKMDGYEFVRSVRAAPHSCTAPIVMISSENAEGDRKRAYQAGANLYMVKPVKADVLLRLARLATGAKR